MIRKSVLALPPGLLVAIAPATASLSNRARAWGHHVSVTPFAWRAMTAPPAVAPEDLM